MSFFDASAIREDLHIQLKLIAKIVDSIENRKSKHAVDNNIQIALPVEFLYVYTHLISKDTMTSPLRKLFLDFFQSLEMAFPTGAFIGAKLLVSQCEDIVWGSPRRPTSTELLDRLRDVIGHEAHHVVSQIIKSGGIYRPVVWDEMTGEDYVINAHESRSININIDESFASGIEENIFYEKAMLVISDCVFERMSEIDVLVRGSIDNNRPVFLVARGFLPDVSFTLLHNFILKKTNIIPCVIELNDGDPFEMLDVSKISGADIVPGSLSTYTWDNIDEMTTSVFDCKLLGYQVRLGISEVPLDDFVGQALYDEREEVSNPDRIKRIMRNSIAVKFPVRSNVISKSRIKKGLLLYRQWARFGVCDSMVCDFPVTFKLVQRALQSTRSMKDRLSNVKFCVRVDDGLEEKMAMSK